MSGCGRAARLARLFLICSEPASRQRNVAVVLLAAGCGGAAEVSTRRRARRRQRAPGRLARVGRSAVGVGRAGAVIERCRCGRRPRVRSCSSWRRRAQTTCPRLRGGSFGHYALIGASADQPIAWRISPECCPRRPGGPSQAPSPAWPSGGRATAGSLGSAQTPALVDAFVRGFMPSSRGRPSCEVVGRSPSVVQGGRARGRRPRRHGDAWPRGLLRGCSDRRRSSARSSPASASPTSSPWCCCRADPVRDAVHGAGTTGASDIVFGPPAARSSAAPRPAALGDRRRGGATRAGSWRAVVRSPGRIAPTHGGRTPSRAARDHETVPGRARQRRRQLRPPPAARSTRCSARTAPASRR